jgi:putative acetyltransferase
MDIRKRVPADNAVLVEIWLRSVRETHAFLREQDIEKLYPQVRDTYLPGVDVWVSEDDKGLLTGFIGVHEAQIEMLFVDPGRFGQGIGTALLDHAKALNANLTVDVNEQNPRAHELYRSYGFEDIGRSATDSAGRPFPLVHMALRPW